MEKQETLDDLLKSQEEIAQRIKTLKSEGRANALANVLKTIKDFELTLTELKGAVLLRKPRAKNGEGVKKVPVPGAKRGPKPKNKVPEKVVNAE